MAPKNPYDSSTATLHELTRVGWFGAPVAVRNARRTRGCPASLGERQRGREAERHTDRETERQRDRKTEATISRQRDRETKTQRKRDSKTRTDS